MCQQLSYDTTAKRIDTCCQAGCLVASAFVAVVPKCVKDNDSAAHQQHEAMYESPQILRKP